MDEITSIRGGLLVLVTLVVFVATLRKPHVGLIFFIVISLLQDNLLRDQFKAAYEVLRLPVLTMMVTAFGWILNRNEYKNVLKPAQLVLLAFIFVIMVISTANAGGDLATNFPVSRFWKILVLFFLTVNLINTEERFKQLLWALVLVYTAMGVSGYYNYKIEGYEIAMPSGMPMGGIGGNFGGRTAAIVAISYTLFWLEKGIYKKAFLAFSVLILTAAAVTSFSRASALALGAGYMALMFFDLQNRQKRFATIALVIMMGAFVLYRAEGLQTNLGTISTFEEDGSAMARLYQLDAAMNIMKSNALLGLGPGNFGGSYVDFISGVDGKFDPEMNKSMHNTIFQMGAEVGIIAVSLLVLILIKTFFDFLKIRKINSETGNSNMRELGTAVSISFGIYFIQSMFIPGAYNNFLYLLISLVVVASYIVSKQMNPISEPNNGRKIAPRPILKKV